VASTLPPFPAPRFRLPLVAMWSVPFSFVLCYVLLVHTFFHEEARWATDKLVDILVLLLAVTLLFSFLWYLFAYATSLVFGEWGSSGVLLLISKIPGLNRHVVITPPTRPDTRREVWGRFGALLLVLLGFELIFMIVIVRHGQLSPGLVLGHPFYFFRDEVLCGILLAALLSPVGAFFVSRVRLRITDSLEFPLLWLALILLIVGGTSVLEVEVLPGAVINPELFFTSVLFYAPAAWFVALAFSRTEATVQRDFLRRIVRYRNPRLHFGHLLVRDEPEGTTTQL
jgi:hypothetical protein